MTLAIVLGNPPLLYTPLSLSLSLSFSPSPLSDLVQSPLAMIWPLSQEKIKTKKKIKKTTIPSENQPSLPIPNLTNSEDVKNTQDIFVKGTYHPCPWVYCTSFPFFSFFIWSLPTWDIKAIFLKLSSFSRSGIMAYQLRSNPPPPTNPSSTVKKKKKIRRNLIIPTLLNISDVKYWTFFKKEIWRMNGFDELIWFTLISSWMTSCPTEQKSAATKI